MLFENPLFAACLLSLFSLYFTVAFGVTYPAFPFYSFGYDPFKLLLFLVAKFCPTLLFATASLPIVYEGLKSCSSPEVLKELLLFNYFKLGAPVVLFTEFKENILPNFPVNV